MEILLASLNKDKIKEIRGILKTLPIKIITFEDLPSFPRVKEDGKTLQENAIKKASIWSNQLGKVALADDSGLEVDYLHGAPGVYSSSFAGEGISYDDNNTKLLRLLEGVEWKKRTAQFRCVVALFFPDSRKKLFRGCLEGFITTKAKGKGGFGYDPVFFIPRYGKTLAELEKTLKNRISHRGIAFMKLKKYLEKWLE